MDEMDFLQVVYLICFFVGLGFAIISGLLSGVFSGGGDVDVDAGGIDGFDGGDGGLHFSPLSPVTLAMFIASFGGAGIIFHDVLKWPVYAHLPLAAISGVVMAGLVFYLFYKVFSITQGSSHAKARDIVGMEVEISLAIPNNGLGEVTYTMSGSRYTAPARTVDGKELPAHIQVRVARLVGSTCVVEKINTSSK